MNSMEQSNAKIVLQNWMVEAAFKNNQTARDIHQESIAAVHGITEADIKSGLDFKVAEDRERRRRLLPKGRARVSLNKTLKSGGNIILVFELLTVVDPHYDLQTRTTKRKFKMQFKPGSKLYEFVSTWQGREFTEAEQQEARDTLDSFKGQTANGVISHFKDAEGNTCAYLSAVYPDNLATSIMTAELIPEDKYAPCPAGAEGNISSAATKQVLHANHPLYA